VKKPSYRETTTLSDKASTENVDKSVAATEPYNKKLEEAVISSDATNIHIIETDSTEVNKNHESTIHSSIFIAALVAPTSVNNVTNELPSSQKDILRREKKSAIVRMGDGLGFSPLFSITSINIDGSWSDGRCQHLTDIKSKNINDSLRHLLCLQDRFYFNNCAALLSGILVFPLKTTRCWFGVTRNKYQIEVGFPTRCEKHATLAHQDCWRREECFLPKYTNR